jgi:acetyl-CoA carboxylase biotin carboxyl carrier protein
MGITSFEGGGILGQTIHKVVSPLMGTFYRSSDPDSDPFVEIGQKVNPGDVVCVIESMKIFTELRTELAGTVQSILVDNEDAVMKNQALIEIEVDA